MAWLKFRKQAPDHAKQAVPAVDAGEAAAIEAPPAPPDAPPAAPRMICTIDGPSGWVVPGELFRVFGWAVSAEGVAGVEVQFDDAPPVAARIGYDRPDIAVVHADMPGAGQSGFAVEDATLPEGLDGQVALKVTVRSAGGACLTVTREIGVAASAVGFAALWRTATPPDAPRCLRFAAGMRELGRVTEAELVLAAAMARWPGEYTLAAAWAELEAEYDEAETLRRWGVVGAAFPGERRPYVRRIEFLKARAAFDEAREVAERFVAAFPGDPEPLEERARVMAREALMTTDHKTWLSRNVAAQRAWADVRAQFPEREAGYCEGAHSYFITNQFSEADALLLGAMERYPAVTSYHIWYAWSAENRYDWALAIERWETAIRLFPERTDLPPKLANAQERLRAETMLEEGVLVSEPGRVGAPEAGSALPLRDLMVKFEGLGGNCDFGAVQRVAGAEPLGLLRFAGGSPLESLLDAFGARFEGVGDPEQVIFEIRNMPRPEYWTADRRYGFSSHTNIFPEDVPSAEEEAKLFAKQCLRLKFLARKLVEDLEAGTKIFVYQSHERLTAEEQDRLFDAVNRYGPNTLLCVGPAFTDKQPGTVEVRRERLMYGYLKDYVVYGAPSIDFHNWNKVLRRAYEISIAAEAEPVARVMQTA